MARSTKTATKPVKEISEDLINSDSNLYFRVNSELNQFHYAAALRGNLGFTVYQIQFWLYSFEIIDMLN